MTVSYADAERAVVDEMAGWSKYQSDVYVISAAESADYFWMNWCPRGYEAGIEGMPSVFVDKRSGGIIRIWPANEPERYKRMISDMTVVDIVHSG